jgi:hypothetical protein
MDRKFSNDIPNEPYKQRAFAPHLGLTANNDPLETTNEWLRKAIPGKSICLDDSQLEEFLFQTKGNTYANAYIAIRRGDSETLESCIMTLSKEPLHTIPFYTRYPQILPKYLAMVGDLNLYS